MPSTTLPVAALVTAYIVSDLIVPRVVRLASTYDLFDFPDRDRRGHKVPMPRLGGVAVFAGIAFALIFAKTIQALLEHGAPDFPPLTLAIGGGCAILFFIGLADDLRGVRPVAKVFGQTAAALLVIYAGFRVEVISLPPNVTLHLGWASIPVTIFWLVGVSNAINLVDGLDGLAGGIAVIGLLATTVSGIVLGNSVVIWEAFAVIGALLGFLRHNKPPAKIFLGDCGSLVVGFLLATLSVRSATRADGVTFAVAPVFALSYPLLDTGIAILRRWLRGVPFSRADGRHIHHQLRSLGLTAPKAVSAILLQAFAFAILGLCVTFAPPSVTVAVTTIGGIVLFFVFAYGLKWLQYHEFIEAGASLTSAVLSARAVIRDKITARDIERLIDGAQNLIAIDGLLATSCLSFRFEFMGVIRAGEELVTGKSFGDGTLLKLEYPITPLYEGTLLHPTRLLTLAIVARTDRETSSSPERIARIVAPAIARWINASREERFAEICARYAKPLTLELGDKSSLTPDVPARRAGAH